MMSGFLPPIVRWSTLALCVTFTALAGYCHAEDKAFHFSVTQVSANETESADAGAFVSIPIENDGGTVVEVRLFINHEPREAAEERALALLFNHFDRNHDDAICAEESRFLPDLSQNAQLLWNPLGAPRMLHQSHDAPRSFASRQALIDWYRQQGSRCFHVGFGRDQASGPLSDRLKEIIKPLPKKHPANPVNEVALARFKQLDANADGYLSADELIRDVIYPSTSASEPLADATGRKASTRWTINITRSVEPSTQDHSTSFHRLGQWDDVTVLVRYDAGSLADELKRSHEFLSELFDELDHDQDDQLSQDELNAKTARLMRTYVPFADADRDQFLTRSELEGWLRLWQQWANSQWQLSLVEQKIGLWERFDEDHDGRLSVAEWCQGAGRRDATESDLHHEANDEKQLRVTISPGRPRTLTATIHRSGPAWFRAADANGDGVIQKEEFVGPLATFAKLDANGDGMIDNSESIDIYTTIRR